MVWTALCTPLALADDEEEQTAELSAPTLHGKLALSIADAVAMGLKNNLDLEVQRFAPVIAFQDAEGAWGAFDPEAFAEFGYQEETTPNAFLLAQTLQLREETTDGVGGFRGLLPYLGATYEVSLSGERRLTNSLVQALSPELAPSGRPTFSQVSKRTARLSGPNASWPTAGRYFPTMRSSRSTREFTTIGSCSSGKLAGRKRC